jgi:RNA polymerase sigma-70 factor (ECF subfamily)
VTDGSWFEQFYSGSYARLVIIALGFTRDLAEAEEVVQEAFLRAYARQSRLAGVHNPEAWVCTVAMNVARRRHRRRVMADRLLLRGARDRAGSGRATDPSALTEHADLMAAIAELPDDQRQAVVLHYLADLPVTEVAVRTGVAVGTVKSRLFRARAAMQQTLRGVADEDLLATDELQEADDHG